MGFVADYDPATFVQGVFATYPPLPPGTTLYQPAQWWNSIGTGTMSGQSVLPGDRIYAAGRPRLWGEFLWGDMVYGNPPDRDWPVEVVSWLIWSAATPPETRPPYPYSGCPFGQPGEFGPGQWHIVIDSLFNDLLGSRTYGSLLWGDEVYGDVNDEARYRWNDITQPAYSIMTVAGTADGNPAVPVNTMELELVDDDGTWSDMADPAWWYQPFVGSPLRVGFFDPAWRYQAVLVGTIEQIMDDHDIRPRTVRIQAFGNDRELASPLVGWQRPAERVSARFNALMAAGHWRFGTGALVFPGDADLHADTAPRDVTTRAELDRTVMSAGWMFDTDPWGQPRLREWPLLPEGDVLQVVDCADPDQPSAVVSPMIRYVADEALLLNAASLANMLDPPVVATVTEPFSVSLYGRRGEALGFPQTGLAFTTSAAAEALATRYINRLAFIIRRPSSVDADTLADPRWLEELVALDTGRGVAVTRTALRPFTLDGVVVGMSHRITPGRWQSQINIAATTETH